MVKNYKWLGVITLCIILNFSLCAQVLRWEGMPENEQDSGAQDRMVTELPRSVFPKFSNTGNPAQDKERFKILVSQWNAQNPDRELQESQIADILSGSRSEKEIQQELYKTKELNRLNPQYREMQRAKQVLTEYGLGHAWGVKGMPDYPKATSDDVDYTNWVYSVKIWTQSEEYAIQNRLNENRLLHSPMEVNPTDLVKPVYIDTGNAEHDDEVYHQKKLRYSEALELIRRQSNK
jgi:hypothetical protein